MAKRNVWSFNDLQELNEGEVDALLVEIPFDGESVDEFEDEEGEEDAVDPMDTEDYTEEITVASTQNSSDSEEDEDNVPLSHFLPKDKFIWKKPLIVTNTDNIVGDFSELVGPTNISDDIEFPFDIFGWRKGIPEDFKADKELKRGDFDWRITDDGISCVKWMDKRIVLLASNCENPSEINHVIRKKRNGEAEKCSLP
ncbi:hypothetical protein NQ314_003503 [Rhamnusium bicolor]|uniref:PiggyBac transposable element-derived protein domain-containing protein n=1 Tax=Rhamnusium bicolor TaxID=1586634 RepID=A0AAV8ZPP2_9CUCU|nr:hypothetical protein NQ314_003503 [Rhamnusium bicolor]